jgi:hypothetical protein
MKKFLALVTVLLISITVYAADAPTPPWFSAIAPDVFLSDATSGQEGAFVQKTVRFVYDGATDGYTSAAHGLGVYLPARAVITRSYFKIITQFADSGTTTLALHCEDANNIKTATDITGSSADAFVEGQSTGAASAFVRGISAPCEITATPAGAANNLLQAGKLVGWVTYVLEN